MALLFPGNGRLIVQPLGGEYHKGKGRSSILSAYDIEEKVGA